MLLFVDGMVKDWLGIIDCNSKSTIKYELLIFGTLTGGVNRFSFRSE